MRVDQFGRIDQFATAITLVTLSVTVVAHGTFSAHKPISQKALTLLAVLLIDNFLEGFVLCYYVLKDCLGDLCLLRGAGATESIEVTIEPIVDLLVDLVIVVTDLLTGFTLLHSFGLSGGSILVSTTHVYRVVAGETCIPCEHIS